MKNLLIAICLFFFTWGINAQTGNFSFYLRYHEQYTDDDIVLIDLKLYRSDTLFTSFELHHENGYTLEEEIDAGVYRLVLLIDGLVVQVIDPCEIVDGEDTEVEMRLPAIDHYKQTDYSDDFHAFLNYNFLTGGYRLNQDSKFWSNYNFGMKFGFQQALWNYQALGFEYGYNFNYIYLQKEGYVYPDQNFKTERYFYLNMDFVLYTRIALYNLRSNKKTGAFIDLGATYNFPFLFRHVGIRDNYKAVTRRIHGFNDFTLYGRVGYGPFAFTLQYGLTDFVKDPLFPQVPTIKAGITILLYDNLFDSYYYEQVD